MYIFRRNSNRGFVFFKSYEYFSNNKHIYKYIEFKNERDRKQRIVAVDNVSPRKRFIRNSRTTCVCYDVSIS